jgi:hypothetical protein
MFRTMTLLVPLAAILAIAAPKANAFVFCDECKSATRRVSKGIKEGERIIGRRVKPAEPKKSYCGRWRDNERPVSSVHEATFHSRSGPHTVEIHLAIEFGTANVIWVKSGACSLYPKD